MSAQLEERPVTCPYCWETITVLLDPGDAGSSYIEDCQVCCRPIVFGLQAGLDGELTLSVGTDDD